MTTCSQKSDAQVFETNVNWLVFQCAQKSAQKGNNCKLRETPKAVITKLLKLSDLWGNDLKYGNIITDWTIRMKACANFNEKVQESSETRCNWEINTRCNFCMM